MKGAVIKAPAKQKLTKSKEPRPASVAFVAADLPPTIRELTDNCKGMSDIQKKKQAVDYYNRAKDYETGKLVPNAGDGDAFARSYYEASAKLGHLAAHSALGVFHAHGKGGLKANEAAALASYKIAAAGKDVRAIRNLALYHGLGRADLYPDGQEAFSLLNEACPQPNEQILHCRTVPRELLRLAIRERKVDGRRGGAWRDGVVGRRRAKRTRGP